MMQHFRVGSVTNQDEPILDRVYIYNLYCICVCARACMYLKQSHQFPRVEIQPEHCKCGFSVFLPTQLSEDAETCYSKKAAT